MKPLLFIAFLLATSIISCKKEAGGSNSGNASGKGSITLNGQTETANYAEFGIDTITYRNSIGFTKQSLLSITSLGGSTTDGPITDAPPTPPYNNPFNGVVSAISVTFTTDFHNKIPIGTFSFNGWNHSGYDSLTNFTDAFCYFNVTVVNSSTYGYLTGNNSFLIEYYGSNWGMYYEMCQPSTVTIQKNGDNTYMLTFSIRFSNQAADSYTLLTATYTGSLEISYLQ
jgi:hypothetical protein